MLTFPKEPSLTFLNMTQFALVRDADDALEHVETDSTIGLDTEFMREKTYFAELCLLQISGSKGLVCVDPLGDDELEGLWERLAQAGWVVHAARQDLEVLWQTANVLPGSLFDTQIAAGLAGHPPQLGYAGLVKTLFDVELPKTHTRADWKRRPLRRELLEYAAEDVEYLLPMRDALAESLDALGRLDWARTDSALLLEPRLYEPDPANAIDRLKGARNFRGRRRNAAALLASWRERRAIDRNKPRQWIVKDSVLLDIAWRLPSSQRQLAAIQDMPPRLAERHGKTIVGLVQQSERDDGGYRPPTAPDEAQKAVLRQMQDTVAEAARSLGLASEIVASKKELSAAVLNDDRSGRVFTAWRRDLVGGALLAML